MVRVLAFCCVLIVLQSEVSIQYSGHMICLDQSEPPFLQVSTDEASQPQPRLTGVLITGGYPSSSVGNKAELYVPSTGVSCTLPSLPEERGAHTVSEGGLLCGGRYTEDSCILWSPDSGTWEEALTLDVSRKYHVSWTPSSGNTGTYLMGGGPSSSSRKTSTLLNNDGTQEPGFPLKYDA